MDFRFIEDAEGPPSANNGHITHRLELHVSDKDNSGGCNAFYGEEVGYISVTYIPSETWRERYTGDWGLVLWLSDFKGLCGVTSREQIHNDRGDLVGVKENLHKDLEKTVKLLSQAVESYGDRLSSEEVEEMAKKELEMAFDYYTDKLWERHEDHYKLSRRFHVDKPRVQFIRVAKPHRRNGYGTALYRRMTEELYHCFGFSLHDGGIQRDQAETAWKKLINLNWNVSSVEQYPKLAKRGVNQDEVKTRHKLKWRETKQLA